MTALVRRFGWGLTAAIVGLSLFWVFLMVVLPQILMIDFAFRPNLLPADIGGPKDIYTLDNFRTLAENTIHRAIFFKTIWASAFVTVLTLVVCYPIAYYLAQGAKAEQTAVLVLMLIIPFWINEILRTFAWFIIL
ncbi:MAG TPA: ABC transporter permease, partial [Alphaproteobacteria bacterium]|nr:ABC transporter permease [Alphaproteobacteria bacterium]